MKSNYFYFLSLFFIYLDSSQQAFVSRQEWGALLPKREPTKILNNLSFVFIHHTHIPRACYSKKSCMASIRGMQTTHRNKGWNDIGYTFLIGQDGNVYEGRGWGVEGAHTYKYNKKGYGIAFIGDFTKSLPSQTSLKQAKALIGEGINKGYISSTYKLLGHRDLISTSCPGRKLYNHIKTWPEYGIKSVGNRKHL